MADLGNFRRSLTALSTAVLVSITLCAGHASLVFDHHTTTASTAYAGPGPVAEPCAAVELHTVRLLVQRTFTVAQHSAASRNWQIAYRARAFGRA